MLVVGGTSISPQRHRSCRLPGARQRRISEVTEAVCGLRSPGLLASSIAPRARIKVVSWTITASRSCAAGPRRNARQWGPGTRLLDRAPAVADDERESPPSAPRATQPQLCEVRVRGSFRRQWGSSQNRLLRHGEVRSRGRLTPELPGPGRRSCAPTFRGYGAHGP